MTGTTPGSPARRGTTPVVLTGLAAVSAFGTDPDALMSGVLGGTPAFAPVERFDVSARRVRVAATMPGDPNLSTELTRAIGDACDDAHLSLTARSRCPLFLAIHGDPTLGRAEPADWYSRRPAAFAATLAERAGLADTNGRVYTCACVAASTAIADAAAMIARGQLDRVIVAGGYLVESDQFALFDAGRALADDGRVRPFSAGRRGLLLGDGIAAVLLESAPAARSRCAVPLARVVGWGRGGDAHHPCQPHPEGTGLARAITAALSRSGITPADLGYLNAHGSGTGHSDTAEAAALHTALGDVAVPTSSTKGLLGQPLEASGVLELVITVLAARKGVLPINSGFLGPDDACALNLILDQPLRATPAYALSLNAAFGGANTALVVGLP